jgi:hypothetical protein
MEMVKMKKPVFLATFLLFGWICISCDSPTKPSAVSEKTGLQSDYLPNQSHSHGNFILSDGIYRIPYADGTDVLVTRDHHTHSPARDRIDMTAGEGALIVAAASGWIRGIVDHHGESPNPGDGLAADGVTPQDDSLEHSCLNNNPDPEADPPEPPNPIIGSCGDYNNYVWIEHPNGEWTKYTHFGTGTVQLPPPAGFGWSEDDWIEAGEVLGLESDVGAARGGGGVNPGFHLHTEVARPNNPDDDLAWSTNGGFIQNGFNVVPLVCDIQDHSEDDLPIYEDGVTYLANPCQHDPPVADAGGPYEVNEGTSLILDGTGSFDPDGLPLVYSWSPGDFLNDTTLVQPTFVAGTSMTADLTLTVYDQVEALWDSDNTTVTVNNVAPSVTIDPNQTTIIDEGGTVTVIAEFTDPGWLDTHTATIDWGVPAGHQGIELAPAAIQILNPGGPDDPLVGRVTGTYQYGDTDDGSGFTISVTVTDSDGGEGIDSFSLTVNNVDPSVSIDLSDAVFINGVPTIFAAIGEEIEFNGHATDPGSDDLTLTWDWGDGTSDSRLSLVNSPNPDPLPSPTVQPRDEPDQAEHTFADACLYEVTFSAEDDDGGGGSETVDVVISGLADQLRGAGYWMSEYRMTKNPDFIPATLECYLMIANHVSSVFSDHRVLASITDAVDVIWTRGNSSEDHLFDRQLLTAWLNFANGAFTLNQMVDSTGDGIPDIHFQDLMNQAENLRTDPVRTRAAVLAMKDVLEHINGGL